MVKMTRVLVINTENKLGTVQVVRRSLGKYGVSSIKNHSRFSARLVAELRGNQRNLDAKNHF